MCLSTHQLSGIRRKTTSMFNFAEQPPVVGQVVKLFNPPDVMVLAASMGGGGSAEPVHCGGSKSGQPVSDWQVDNRHGFTVMTFQRDRPAPDPCSANRWIYGGVLGSFHVFRCQLCGNDSVKLPVTNQGNSHWLPA